MLWRSRPTSLAARAPTFAAARPLAGRALLALIGPAVLLSACGQKGPLQLPARSAAGAAAAPASAAAAAATPAPASAAAAAATPAPHAAAAVRVPAAAASAAPTR